MANYKAGSDEVKKNSFRNQSDIISQVMSYWPNARGVYNMAGNVAEIVRYSDGEYGTKGGHWKSTAEELKIFAEDKTKGTVEPSPTIGFRVLLEYNAVQIKNGGIIKVKEN